MSLLLATCSWSLQASASDRQPNAPMRLAAVGDGSALPERQPRHAVDALQLVQQMMPESNGEHASEGTIIVSVDGGTPETLDEEIAEDHGLEIAARLVMSSARLRIVSYRIADPERLAAVIERLRADKRINSAQANVAYRPVDPAPEARVTSVEPPIRRPDRAAVEKRRKAAEQHPVRKAKALGDRGRTTVAGGHRVSRIAAADVLAGGL